MPTVFNSIASNTKAPKLIVAKKRVAKKDAKAAPAKSKAKPKQPGTRRASKLDKLKASVATGLIVQHTFKRAADEILPDDEFEDISTIKAQI